MGPSIDQNPGLREKLEGQTELRPFPAVASQILSICDDPDVRPRDLTEVIQCDPAVALRLLRVANSSVYGFAGEIRSIDHAIVVLGFRTVRDLAVAAAAADMFADSDQADAARTKLWLHSLACGSVARALAGELAVAPGEAFLAGIVHDVGKLVFFDVLPQEYQEITREADSTTIFNAEEAAFGVSHPLLGQRCAEQWGLPAEIHAAIAHHHAPESTGQAADLVSLVCVADALAHGWQLGDDNGSEQEIDAAMERTGLSFTAAQLDDIRTQSVIDLETLQESCRP